MLGQKKSLIPRAVHRISVTFFFFFSVQLLDTAWDSSQSLNCELNFKQTYISHIFSLFKLKKKHQCCPVCKCYPTWACSATFVKRRWWTAIFVTYVCLREKNWICCVKLASAYARRAVVMSLKGVKTFVEDQVRWQRPTVSAAEGSWRIWGQSKSSSVSWERSTDDLARLPATTSRRHFSWKDSEIANLPVWC